MPAIPPAGTLRRNSRVTREFGPVLGEAGNMVILHVFFQHVARGKVIIGFLKKSRGKQDTAGDPISWTEKEKFM